MSTRRSRIILALGILAGTSATVALTMAAFQQNLLFFYTPTQLLSGDDSVDVERTFRLGGLVMDNSVRRDKGSLDVSFDVTDTVNAVTVVYRGILPDLFREGQGVVVRGRWRGNLMVADQVLAKHDENYMPLEVSDALEAMGSLQQ